MFFFSFFESRRERNKQKAVVRVQSTYRCRQECGNKFPSPAIPLKQTENEYRKHRVMLINIYEIGVGLTRLENGLIYWPVHNNHQVVSPYS